MRAFTELCGLRMSVEWYAAPKGYLHGNAASASDTSSVTADMLPGVSPVGGPISLAVVLPRGDSISAVAAGETTRRNTGPPLSRKRRRQPLQSVRPSRAESAPIQATLSLRNFSGSGPLPSRWTWASGGATSFEGACRQGFSQFTSTSNSLTPTGHGGAQAA